MKTMFKKIEDIEAWKRGCRLAVEIYNITNIDPFSKDWGLRDQIRRSVVSIPSNIAEGFERESSAEFKRFLLIEKGSCGELRTQLYIAQALDYITKSKVEQLINECKEISSMMSGIISHLRNQMVSK